MARSLHLHFLGTEFLLPPLNNENGSQWHDMNIEDHSTTILSNLTGESRIFCDVSFYLSLRRQYPYSKICVSKIRCWHKMYIHAFQINYSVHHCTSDGNIQCLQMDAPIISLTSNLANTPSIECRTEAISSGEYIIDAHQEGMMERLIFTTNKRTITFGIKRHGRFDRTSSIMRMPRQCQEETSTLTRPSASASASASASRMIVAFGGCSYKNRRLKLAYFTESVNWMLIGDFVLLRSLVESGRAAHACAGTVLTRTKKNDHDILQFLLCSSSIDIFRIVMSFLSYDVTTE